MTWPACADAWFISAPSSALTAGEVRSTHRSAVAMSAAAREYFTVDLHGLRAALAKRAAQDGLTESDVLRSALAAALRSDAAAMSNATCELTHAKSNAPHVKMSVDCGGPPHSG